MIEYLRRFYNYIANFPLGNALSSLFSIIGAFAAAGLGAVLYPLRKLLMISGVTALAIAAATTAFFVLPIIFTVQLSTSLGGIWNGLTVSLLAMSAIVGLVAVVLPAITLVSTFRALFVDSIAGIKKAWKDGAAALLTSVMQVPALPDFRAQETYHALILSLLGINLDQIENDDYNRAVEQHNEAQRRPMDENSFERLRLPQSELATMRHYRAPSLSAQEISTLASSNERNVLSAYQNLQQRLETDHCCISLERPERDDTILLVKQYFMPGRQQQWLPIPGMAHIHSNQELKDYFLTDARHPINQDLILSPNPHEIDRTSYQTRYIIHPYYLTANGPGVSQELMQHSTVLRAYLSAHRRSNDGGQDLQYMQQRV